MHIWLLNNIIVLRQFQIFVGDKFIESFGENILPSSLFKYLCHSILNCTVIDIGIQK